MGAVLDLVKDMEQALGRSEADMSPWFHGDFIWDGNVGCGRKSGLTAFEEGWQQPFRAAFGDRRFDTPIWLEDGDWAACAGTCHATHTGDFMGIPATGRPLRISYVDFWQVRDGRIAYNKVSVDLAGVAAQLGWDVFDGKGWDRLDPPVARLWRGQQSHGAAAKPLDVVHAMEAALQRSDVDVSEYFHDDFVWDANYGCGLKHGLQEFERGWYLPFRDFFGNRDFRTRHFMQDGDWAACFGACHATLETDFMGMPATGQAIRIPYIDFWRIDGWKIAENIVRVDFASVVKQLGGDVFRGMGWENAIPADRNAHPAN
ncbi:ester cyclase [Ruegeria sp. 2012CJ41-6]|uniref:Ester cyclase n=1 Tax=Ruegeria spongiae TaxID=2942209 RepID=A0ABT0Q5R1_9RHOB|nr:ester cyclase [Ruegeria spongiae]MCL6285150.1 ester cyclase [Ruegeria spongiae]